jgi:tetratricopeptide (TPR) repeat protein
MKKKGKTLEQLLDELYEEGGSPSSMNRLVEEIFRLDPENPEALLFLADQSEDPEDALEYLSRCVRSIRKLLEDFPEGEREDMQAFLCEALQRMGWFYILENRGEEAVALSEELLTLPQEDLSWAKAIRYVGLILTEQYSRVLEAVIAEEEPDVFSAHVKAMALLECSAPSRESAIALWDAFRMDPNLPFYLLDFWVPPSEEEDEEEDLESYSRGLLLEPAWTLSESRIMALSTGAVFFGYVTERIPDHLLEEITEELQQNPVFAFLEMARERVAEHMENSDDIHEADMMALDILSTMDSLFL